MADRNEPNYKCYVIPENIVDGGRFMGFKKRQIAEGILLAIAVALLSLLLPIKETTTKISVAVVFAAPFLLLGSVGINGDPVSTFLLHMMDWMKNKGVILYNGTTRFLEESPVDIMMEQEDIRDRITELMEQHRKRVEEQDREKSMIEGVDFEFAEDKDEAGIVAVPTLDGANIPDMELEDGDPFLIEDREEFTLEEGDLVFDLIPDNLAFLEQGLAEERSPVQDTVPSESQILSESERKIDFNHLEEEDLF